MKKFAAGKHVQRGGYQSFTPSFINGQFIWKNPQIDVLLEGAVRLLGELNAYAEISLEVSGFHTTMRQL